MKIKNIVEITWIMDSQNGDGFFSQFLQTTQTVDSDFVMATPLAQDVSRLPPQIATKGSTKKSRGNNFSPEEDIMIVNAWLSVSLDGIVGNEQKSSKLWDRIHIYYHECRMPNHQEKTKHSLGNRWSTIRGSVNKFCGCLAQIENFHLSGHNEDDKIKMAKITYKDTWKESFSFDYCWEILRDQPKWILQKEEVRMKKNRDACTTQFIPETNDIGDKVAHPTHPDQCERPQGRKAQKANEKKRKYSEEKSALFEKVVSSLKEERKKQHDEKMEKIDMLAKIEERKLEQKDRLVIIAEKRLVQEEKEKNNQFMLMDISGLDAMQQEYVQKRRLEILQKYAD